MTKKVLYIPLFACVFFAGVVTLIGCDRHEDDGHEELTRVEILDRSLSPPSVIATWTSATGWDRDVLTTLTVRGADQNYGRASLGVQMYDDHGDLIEMGTVSQNPNTGLRTCTEFFATWGIALQAPQDVVYAPDGSGIVNINGDQRNTYHCDHVHLYPREPGTTEIQFFLFHIDHADAATSPIQVTVQNP